MAHPLTLTPGLPIATADIAPGEAAPASAASPLPSASAEAAASTRAEVALRLQAAVLSQRRAAPAAAAFANELAVAVGATRVAIGFVRGGYARLVAMSHGSGSGLDSEVFDPLACAMDEAIEQGISVSLPATTLSAVRLAHGRLLQRQGGAVATVPLVYLGDVVGAVTCEWAVEPPAFASIPTELEHLVSLVGPVMYLLHLRETPLHERLRIRLRDAMQALRAPSSTRLRFALGLGLIALAGVLAVPMPYRVGGRARIEGESQRALVAPVEGFLKAANVRPGDHVKQGQVLIEMADEDLLLQRRKWASDEAQQEGAYSTALARSERATMVMALARGDEARAQLALIDADLARSRIVAPFDGVVIDGDLSQSLGAPIERGKPLMTLAPAGRHRVVIDVDERDVADVYVGQSGSLALSALPWDSLPIRISRVTPIARTVDAANVFEVEAELSGEADRIRPGLEGVAKIAVGHEPLAWTALHRLADWLRVQFWSWGP